MTQLCDIARSPALAGKGEEMHSLIRRLYPICRSITGNGVRETLRILKERVPLEIQEVPTGTRVFDWTVPKEWNIRDAFLVDPNGRKVVEFSRSNLHVLSYSVPVRKRLPLAELKKHCYTIPDQPSLIPYRTSYYSENWGFCLSHNQFQMLEDGEYEAVIDSRLEPGSLTYAEVVIPGTVGDEILVSCHSCHPSLCNDNLSGLAVAAALAELLGTCAVRYTYRFLFIPGAIGSITWLALNQDKIPLIKGGLVVACAGDPGMLTYKKSRRGDAEIDIAVQHVLRHSGAPYRVKDFVPYGYDERQYCSPGINLAVGSLTRTPHGEFPEYHTSADNPDFVRPAALAGTLAAYLAVFDVLERNRTYLNLQPMCEPQLGRRGIYRAIGGDSSEPVNELAMLWVLNMSDGSHSLLEIAERAGLPFGQLAAAAHVLQAHDLVKPVDRQEVTP
jgi:aminopeptidase-like protein